MAALLRLSYFPNGLFGYDVGWAALEYLTAVIFYCGEEFPVLKPKGLGLHLHSPYFLTQ